MRVARTEVNMAYQASDSERWTRSWWIKGIRVSLSNNHTSLDSKGRPTPLVDICDELAGDYPADFKFTGWHPQCRCFATAITCEYSDIRDYYKRKRSGEDMTGYTPPGAITEPPEQFKRWMADNNDRLAGAAKRGTTPYFIANNAKYTDPNWKPGKATASADPMPAPRPKTPLEIADERHAARTPGDVESIQKAWRQKLIRDITLESARYGDNALMNGYIKSMRDNRIIGDDAAFTSDYNNARKLLATMLRENTSALTFTEEQMKRFAEMETVMKTKRGVPMTLCEADMQSANPDYKYNSPYSINCQTCAPTYVLRSQGFSVVATGKTPGSVQEWISRSHSFDIWENIDGTPAKPTLFQPPLATDPLYSGQQIFKSVG